MATLTTTEKTLTDLYAAVRPRAERLTEQTHLTTEGKKAAWTRETAEHRAELDRARAHLDALEVAADRLVAELEAEVMEGSRLTGTALVAAELEAARIMSRGPLTRETITPLVTTQPRPVAAPILLEEALARGVLTPDLLRALLADQSPLYQSAVREAHLLRTVRATVLDRWVRAIEEVLENYTARPHIAHIPLIETMVPEGLEVAGVPELT